MGYDWSQLMNSKPSTIVLVCCTVQAPTPFVGDDVLVEAFASCAASFPHSDSQFSKPAEYFGKIHETEF